MTTNCILYPEKAKEITPYTDRLIFSLDAPFAEEHDRIRGTSCFNKFTESVGIAKSLGKVPVINFTATRDTIRFLPEMAELASSHGLLLWINPVFDLEKLEGFTKETVDYVKYYTWHKNVAFDLASLELASSFGNSRTRPRCRAYDTTVTITPDGDLMLPCFKNKGGKVKINGTIKSTLQAAREFKFSQGKMDICSGCMMWSYMIPSFFSGLDKYFFLNLRSIISLYWKEHRLRKELKQ